MINKTFPFSLISPEINNKLVKRFYGIAKILSKFRPDLKLNLMQAELSYESDEYIANTILNTVFNFLAMYSFFFFFIAITNLLNVLGFTIAILCPFVLAMVTYNMSMMYPKTLVMRKKKEIEKDLLYALRELLIRSKSGIPLYNSMVGIANSNIGIVAQEFKIVVKEIEAGKSIADALEEMALKNPSEYFRNAIWQIINSIKTGADISETLRASIEALSKEQLVEIKNYGAELNPLALVYMMLSVIIPTLGITFLIIISSFLKIKISQDIFYGILVFLAFFQFFFIGVIKTRRPSLIR